MFYADVGSFGNYKAAKNSLVGGNVVAIALRQAIRLRAMRGALAFQAKKASLSGQGEFLLNPVVYLADIPISVRSQETYTYQAEVTQHAVEDGSIFSDHVILRPLVVEISFGVSNLDSPIYSLEALEALHQSRSLMTLVTEHKQLTDMVMVAFQATNSIPAWGALEARATFQQVRPIVLETVTYNEERVGVPAGETENPSSGPDTSLSAQAPAKQGARKSVVKQLSEVF